MERDRQWRAALATAAAMLLFAGATAARETESTGRETDPAVRPNILWITSEDNGPQLGAYGDAYADTPNLDAFAKTGLRYLNAWSNAPVCAPARTAIIMGVYPQSIGAQHMRSMAALPPEMRLFPELLREAGYYCTNNSKEDYNVEKRNKVWDESSPRAHWRNRPSGAPFFAVFNHTVTHESQVRARPHTPVHDPAKAPLPAYHPDAPEVRRDWAQYYDKLTELDRLFAANLNELEEAGLAEETIVIYFGDHGPGMPRCKRWPYNSGLRVPLIVHIPEKFRGLRPPEYAAGAATDRLVSFVDLAPTMLSLIGEEAPSYMQGRAFLGARASPEHDYLHGFRDRMDERHDMARSVRDKRYVYVRQYLPHLIYGEHVAYMFQTPTTQVWKRLFEEGRLSPEQSLFWRTKPPEELYDLETDPDEVRNLAESPAHQEILARLRAEHLRHALAIGDLGFLPEAEMHARSRGEPLANLARDRERFPLERILAAADWASPTKAEPPAEEFLRNADSAVRYWGVVGLRMRQTTTPAERVRLSELLTDTSWAVRIAAAETLAALERGSQDGSAVRRCAFELLVEGADVSKHDLFTSIAALAAIDRLDELADPWKAALERLPRTAPDISPRNSDYIPRLLDKTLSDLSH